MEFIETWWKCPNDALFVKKLRSEFWKCIIVMFQLGHDFTHLAYQSLFLCATCLYWEPLYFASKSVEIFPPSLYRWSFKNKLTLDLCLCICKAYWELPVVVTFLLIANCYIIVPEILKMCNLWWNSLKLRGNVQITHCLWKNVVRSSGNALWLSFSLAMILPIWPTSRSFYVLPIFIENLCILHRNQLKFFRQPCTTAVLRIN